MAALTKFEKVPNEEPLSPTKSEMGTSRSSTPKKDLVRKEEEPVEAVERDYKPTKKGLEEDPLERTQRRDTALKQKIRHLKLIHRLLAVCLSLAILVPISMTLHKFLTTRNTYEDVTNVSGAGATVRRTAWAANSNTWPTYMYFSIALLSFLFNLTVMLSYFHSVRSANIAATAGTVFNALTLLLNVTIWAVTAALYKQQAIVTTNGKHNDLWGWTCSPAAKLLQPAFKQQINFDQYCDIQAVSWYIGLLQVGALSLALVLYVMALRRLESKKKVRTSTLLYARGT